jgi:hypothetical protein
MNTDDNQLRQPFQEQRVRDERSMPPFHVVRARALARAETPRPVAWGYRLAFATALIALVIGVFAWRAQRPVELRQVASAGSISDWQSPTDSLLQTPGSDWYGSTSLSGLSIADSRGNTKENL